MEKLNNSKKFKKENKWDRIRKKYNTNHTISSGMVKKFLNTNYIDEKVCDLLNGRRDEIHLDPVLVMNLRHDSIPRQDRKTTFNLSSTQAARDLIIQEKRLHHQNLLEKVAIDAEIKKFKNDLKTSNKNNLNSNKVISKQCNVDLRTPLQSENNSLTENINEFQLKSKEFYETCVKAPLLEIDCFEKNDAETCQYETTRTIRFEETIKIKNYRNKEKTLSDSSENENIKQISFTLFQSNETRYDIDEYAAGNLSNNNSDYNNDQISSSPSINFSEDEDVVSIIEEPMVKLSPVKENSTTTNDSFPLTVTQIRVSDKKLQIENPFTNPNVTEREKIIQNLFNDKFYKATQEYQIKLMKKYFQKWTVITNFSKISNKCATNNDNRVKKINDFLVKIREEKKLFKQNDEDSEKQRVGKTHKVGSMLMSRKYQKKLKFQQDVIEIQKLKLERQERMITELKLSKMFEESKFSKTEIKNELRNVIRNGAIKLRAKAKCLQIAANIKAEEEDREAEFRRLQANGNEVPKFLAKMQARALERHLKHEEAKEKRERLEKEREEAKLQAEEAKRLEDEQIKKERLEFLREKRRLEKLKKIQKEKDRLKYLEDLKKANEFYRLKLLKSCGLEPLKTLVAKRKNQEKHAKQFRKRMLMKNCLNSWHMLTVSIWAKKKVVADNFCIVFTMRYTFRLWKKQLLIAQSKLLVAIDLFELRLAEKILKYWNIATKQALIIEEKKLVQADSHYNWQLKWRVIEYWRKLHIILKIEKETEERRQRWRIKIWELLPDYQPNENDE